MNKAETILITGGGGYIGVVAVEEFLKYGYKVKVLDTFYWGMAPLQHLRGKVELIQADIRNVMPNVLKNVEYVIHAAGFSNDPMAEFNPSANFEINTKATKRFARLCRKMGVKKFVFASSASIYYSEINDDKLKDEESFVRPKAAYSLSKYNAEIELLKLADRNFCPIVFRQGTVFGFSPRMRYDLVVNSMVKDALLNKKILVLCKGQQWRPLVDVHDVAHAYIVALEAPEEKIRGQIFNLVYKNYKILELSKIVRRLLLRMGYSNIKIQVSNVNKKDRSYKISGRKIKEILNWEPTTPVESSVKGMIKSIEKWNYTDFSNPRYFNIEWMKLLTNVSQTLKVVKKVF